MSRPIFLLLALAACAEPVATVRVTIPDLHGIETPVSQQVVTFLPYDRDSVLEVLEARAESGRPHTRQLDSLFGIFRQPFQDYLLLNDSLTRARERGDSGAALAALEARAAAAQAALGVVREQVFPEMTRLRRDVAAWEDTTFAEYRKFTRGLSGRIFASPVADTTDTGGWAGATLTDGRWWVTARALDPTDPNREWYWNLPVSGDTVLLDPRTGRNRPRY